MSSLLSRSGPGGEASLGKFNFGVGKRGGESLGYGCLEADRSLFRSNLESSSEM